MHALYHETNREGFQKIMHSGKLMTGADLNNKGLYANNFGSGGFPGVYLSLLYDKQKLKLEEDDGIILVFPIELLLKQHNYHYNLIDKNGTCGYDTYHSHNIHEAPHPEKLEEFCSKQINKFTKRQKKWPGNEVVFHDSIDIRLLSCICVPNDAHGISSRYNIININDFTNLTPIKCKTHQIKYLNTTALPVLVTLSDIEYSGVEYGFYNKKRLIKVANKDFVDWTKAAIPKGIDAKTKQEVDEWLRSSQLIEKLLLHEIDRKSQNFEGFFEILESRR